MEGSFVSTPHVSFQFHVEKILNISSDGNYQVQWAPAWVSKFHLVGCEDLIQEFFHQKETATLVPSTVENMDGKRNGNTDLPLVQRNEVSGIDNNHFSESGDQSEVLAVQNSGIKTEPEEPMEETVEMKNESAFSSEPISSATPAKILSIEVESLPASSPPLREIFFNGQSLSDTPSRSGGISHQALGKENMRHNGMENESQNEIRMIRGKQEMFYRLQKSLGVAETYSSYVLRKCNSRRDAKGRVATDERREESYPDQVAGKSNKRRCNSGVGTNHSKETVDDCIGTQPKLLTGYELRQYQIEGMKRMLDLRAIGLKGVLAFEKGQSKRLQAIAVICSLIEQKTKGPYMIAAPVSALSKWVEAFKNFAPEIYIVLYHGTEDECGKTRKTMMKWVKMYGDGSHSFPVVITSYDALMRDCVELNAFGKTSEWKYLIMDESHRIKNFDCKLINALKQYNIECRLLLSGAPLPSNHSELWFLFNLLVPEIAEDLVDDYQQWLALNALDSQISIASEQETHVVQMLHSILNPFVMRQIDAFDL